MRSEIAGVMSVCLLPITPCRSLAPARSLLPSPRHRLHRCHRFRPICRLLNHHASALAPFPSCLSIALLGGHRIPPACLLHHRPRHLSSLLGISSPPLAPSYLSNGGEGLRVGCWLRAIRMSSPCCLLAPCRFPPRTIWLSPISSPSPREVCFHACADGGSFGCGADAMRSPLPASPFKRFNCF